MTMMRTPRCGASTLLAHASDLTHAHLAVSHGPGNLLLAGIVAAALCVAQSKTRGRFEPSGHRAHFDWPNVPPSKEACHLLFDGAKDLETVKALHVPGVKCCGADSDEVIYELRGNREKRDADAEEVVRIPKGTVNLTMNISGGNSDLDLYLVDKSVFPYVYVVHWKEGFLHDLANRYMRNDDGEYDLVLRPQRLSGIYEGMRMQYSGDDKEFPSSEFIQIFGITTRALFIQVNNHGPHSSRVRIGYSYDGMVGAEGWKASGEVDMNLWPELLKWLHLGPVNKISSDDFVFSLKDTEDKAFIKKAVDKNGDGSISEGEFNEAQRDAIITKESFKITLRYCERNPCKGGGVDEDDRKAFESLDLVQVEPADKGCKVQASQANSSAARTFKAECPGRDEGKDLRLRPELREGTQLGGSELWEVLCDEEVCRCRAIHIGEEHHWELRMGQISCMALALAPKNCQDCVESRSQEHADHVHSRKKQRRHAPEQHLHVGCPEALLQALTRRLDNEDDCAKGFGYAQELHEESWPIIWVNIHRSETLEAAVVSAVADIFGPIGLVTAVASAGTLQALSKYITFLMLLTQFNGQLGLPEKFVRFADSFSDVKSLLSIKQLFSKEGLRRLIKKLSPLFSFFDFDFMLPLSAYVKPFMAPIVASYLQGLGEGACINHTEQFMETFFNPTTQGVKSFSGSDEDELIKKKQLLKTFIRDMKALNESNGTDTKACNEDIDTTDHAQDAEHRRLFTGQMNDAEEAEMLLKQAWQQFTQQFRPMVKEVDKKLKVFKAEFKLLKKLMKVFVLLPVIVFIYLVIAILCRFLRCNPLWVPALNPWYMFFFLTDLAFMISVQALAKMYFLDQDIKFVNPFFEADLPGPLCLLTHHEHLLYIREEYTDVWAVLFFTFYPGALFYLMLLTFHWLTPSLFKLSKKEVAYHQWLRQFTDKTCLSIKARMPVMHFRGKPFLADRFFYECPRVVEIAKVQDDDDDRVMFEGPNYPNFKFFQECISFELRSADGRLLVVPDLNEDGTCNSIKKSVGVQKHDHKDVIKPRKADEICWELAANSTEEFSKQNTEAGPWRLWTLVECEDEEGNLDGTIALRTYTAKGEASDLLPGKYLSVTVHGQVYLSDEITARSERFALEELEKRSDGSALVTLRSKGCNEKFLEIQGSGLGVSSKEAHFSISTAGPKTKFHMRPCPQVDAHSVYDTKTKSWDNYAAVDFGSKRGEEFSERGSRFKELHVRLLDYQLPGGPGTSDNVFKDMKLKDIRIALKSSRGFKRCGLQLAVRLCRGDRVVKTTAWLNMPTAAAKELRDDRLELLQGLWRDRLLQHIRTQQERKKNEVLRELKREQKRERDEDRVRRKELLLSRQANEMKALDDQYRTAASHATHGESSSAERIRNLEAERDRRVQQEDDLHEANKRKAQEERAFEHPCGCGVRQEPCSFCGVSPCFCESGKCACGRKRCVMPCRPCGSTRRSADDELRAQRESEEEEVRHQRACDDIHCDFERGRREVESEEQAQAEKWIETDKDNRQKRKEYEEKKALLKEKHEAENKAWDNDNEDNEELNKQQHKVLEDAEEKYGVVLFKAGCLIYDHWFAFDQVEEGMSKVQIHMTLQVQQNKGDDAAKYKQQASKAKTLFENALENPRNLQGALKETRLRNDSVPEAVLKSRLQDRLVYLAFAEEETWQMPVPTVPPTEQGTDDTCKDEGVSISRALLLSPAFCKWLPCGSHPQCPTWLWGGFCCGGPTHCCGCFFCPVCALTQWGWANARGKHLIKVAMPGDYLEVWLVGKRELREGYFSQLCALSEEESQWRGDLAVKATFELYESDERYTKPDHVDVLVTRTEEGVCPHCGTAWSADVIESACRKCRKPRSKATKEGYLEALDRFEDMRVGHPKMGVLTLLGDFQVKLNTHIFLRDLRHIKPKVRLKVPLSHLDFPNRDKWRYFYVKDLTNMLPPAFRKFCERVILGAIFALILVVEYTSDKSDEERAQISYRFLIALVFFQLAMVCETQLLDEHSTVMAHKLHRSKYNNSLWPNPRTIYDMFGKIASRATFTWFILLTLVTLFLSVVSQANIRDFVSLTVQMTIMLLIGRLVADDLMEDRLAPSSFLDIAQAALILVVLFRAVFPLTSDVNMSICLILWVLWALFLINIRFYGMLFQSHMKKVKEYTDDVDDKPGTCYERFCKYVETVWKKYFWAKLKYQMMVSCDFLNYWAAWASVHRGIVKKALIVAGVCLVLTWKWPLVWAFVLKPAHDWVVVNLTWLHWTYCGGNLDPLTLVMVFLSVSVAFLVSIRFFGPMTTMTDIMVASAIGIAVGLTAADGATVGISVGVLLGINIVALSLFTGVIVSTALGVFMGVMSGFALGGQKVGLAVIVAVGLLGCVLSFMHWVKELTEGCCWSTEVYRDQYPYSVGRKSAEEVKEVLQEYSAGRSVTPFPRGVKVLSKRSMLMGSLEFESVDIQEVHTFVDDKALVMESVMKRQRGIEFCPPAQKRVLVTPKAAKAPRKLVQNTPVQLSQPRFDLLTKVVKKEKALITPFLLPDETDEMVCTMQVVNCWGLEVGLTDRHDGVLTLWRSRNLPKPIQLARWFEECVGFFADYGADFRSGSSVYSVLEALFYDSEFKVGETGMVEKSFRGVKKLAIPSAEGDGFLDLEEEFQEMLVLHSPDYVPSARYHGNYSRNVVLRMNPTGQLEWKSETEDWILELTEDPAYLKATRRGTKHECEAEVAFSDPECQTVKHIMLQDVVYERRSMLKARPSYVKSHGTGILTAAIISAPVVPELLHVVITEEDLHPDEVTQLPFPLLREERAEQMQHAFCGSWVNESTGEQFNISTVDGKYAFEPNIKELQQWSGTACSVTFAPSGAEVISRHLNGQVTATGRVQWDDGSSWLCKDVVFAIGRDQKLYKQTRMAIQEKSPWRPSGNGLFQSVAVHGDTIYTVEYDREQASFPAGRILMSKLKDVSPMSEWREALDRKVLAITVDGGTLYMAEENGIYKMSLGRSLAGQQPERVCSSPPGRRGNGGVPSFAVKGDQVYSVGNGQVFKWAGKPGVSMSGGSGWELVSNSRRVVSIAIEEDVIYAVGADSRVYRQTLGTMSRSSEWKLWARGGMLSLGMPMPDRPTIGMKLVDGARGVGERIAGAASTVASSAAAGATNLGRGVLGMLGGGGGGGGGAATEAAPHGAHAATRSEAIHTSHMPLMFEERPKEEVPATRRPHQALWEALGVCRQSVGGSSSREQELAIRPQSSRELLFREEALDDPRIVLTERPASRNSSRNLYRVEEGSAEIRPFSGLFYRLQRMVNPVSSRLRSQPQRYMVIDDMQNEKSTLPFVPVALSYRASARTVSREANV